MISRLVENGAPVELVRFKNNSPPSFKISKFVLLRKVIISWLQVDYDGRSWVDIARDMHNPNMLEHINKLIGHILEQEEEEKKKEKKKKKEVEKKKMKQNTAVVHDTDVTQKVEQTEL